MLLPPGAILVAWAPRDDPPDRRPSWAAGRRRPRPPSLGNPRRFLATAAHHQRRKDATAFVVRLDTTRTHAPHEEGHRPRAGADHRPPRSPALKRGLAFLHHRPQPLAVVLGRP